MESEVDKGGRPTKYESRFNDQVYKLCLLGATDKEIADILDVAESTLNLWKKEHAKFSESIKAGKADADANIASRLYQRAMGYEHDSEEIKVISVGKEGSEVERVPIRKIYPPDTVAAIFWLKNRQPDKWREKQTVAHEGIPDSPSINVYTTAPPFASSEDRITDV